MIDYLEIFHQIQNRLPEQNVVITSMIHAVITIISFAYIYNTLNQNKKYKIIIIISATIIIVLDLFSIIYLTQNQKLTQDNIKQFQTKEHLTENITLDDIKYLKLMYTVQSDPKTLSLYKNEHYYDSNLNDILQYANIKSIMNFARNISYLHKHYKNIYASESEYEYINKILNEFYNPNQTEDITDNDILNKLKN